MTHAPNDLTDFRPTADMRTGRPQPSRTGAPRRRRPPRRPRPGGWSLTTRILAALGLIFVGLAIALGAFLFIVSPASLVRDELVRQVKRQTGRDLVIAGPTSFTFYPSIGVSLADVTLSPPPELAGDPLLRAGRIDLSVALMPLLLSQEVHVEHVGLVRPVIDLRVEADGRASWDFAAGLGTTRVAQVGSHAGNLTDALPAEPGFSLAAAAVPVPTFLDRLELRSISLAQGQVRYLDRRSGTAEVISDVDLRLTGKRLADPIRARGGLVWNGERIEFSADLDTPSALLAGRAAKTKLTLNGRPLAAGFDGDLKLSPTLEATGQSRLAADSLANAARWAGVSLPNAGPLGGASVSGRLVASGQNFALNGAALSLGETRARGAIRIAFGGARPRVSADLNISQLNIDRLAAAFTDAAAAGTRPAAPKAGAAPAVAPQQAPAAQIPSKPQSIEDILRRSHGPNEGAGRFSPQVRGFAKRENSWSDEPLPVEALRLVDADAKLSIEGLKVGGLAIGRSIIRLALADGASRVDIDDMALYGGRGKGILKFAGVGRDLSLGANLTLDDVSAQPLLKDAAEIDRLAGTGALRAAIAGRGISEQAIASSLKGTASFTFRDGAVVGWNVAQILRGLQQGQISDLSSTPSAKTDFSDLSASFEIISGQARTNDLRMSSPLLRLTGAGAVDIGGRQLDLVVRPKLVGSLQGQGGRNDLLGLEIPVKIAGPWHDPKVAPDISGVVNNPDQVVETARRIGEQFKGKSVGDVVRGLFGNGGNAAANGGETGQGGQPQQQEGTSDRAKQLLRDLFR